MERGRRVRQCIVADAGGRGGGGPEPHRQRLFPRPAGMWPSGIGRLGYSCTQPCTQPCAMICTACTRKQSMAKRIASVTLEASQAALEWAHCSSG